MKLGVKDAIVPQDRLKRVMLTSENTRKEMMRVVRERDWDSPMASILLPDESISHIESLARKYSDIDLLVIAGIGGSNLGTQAVLEAIQGKDFATPKPQVIFLDTVDADKTSRALSIVQDAIQNKKKVLVNCVTKSGSTPETIANFTILFSMLKKANLDLTKHIVCTTDKDSKLDQVCAKLEIPVLHIPKMVGGRYSVFSAVGLFPLKILGISIRSLIKGAEQIRMLCMRKSGNPALTSASVLKFHHDGGKSIHDLFLFSTDLEGVGRWYRQLMGESIGKELDERKRRVLEGMTPTVSVGSTDLHSMAQLYLGGPFDKVTTLITVDQSSSVKVPKVSELADLVEDIQGKQQSDIMSAISKGVIQAFRKANRPVMTLTLPNKKEETIGALLQMFEMQMMFLGHMLRVNPFDQPAVEKYKAETRKLLKK